MIKICNNNKQKKLKKRNEITNENFFISNAQCHSILGLHSVSHNWLPISSLNTNFSLSFFYNFFPFLILYTEIGHAWTNCHISNQNSRNLLRIVYSIFILFTIYVILQPAPHMYNLDSRIELNWVDLYIEFVLFCNLFVSSLKTKTIFLVVVVISVSCLL